jgi:hypothetical protein
MVPAFCTKCGCGVYEAYARCPRCGANEFRMKLLSEDGRSEVDYYFCPADPYDPDMCAAWDRAGCITAALFIVGILGFCILYTIQMMKAGGVE